MSRSDKTRPTVRAWRRPIPAILAAALLLPRAAGAQAEVEAPDFWLQFGRPAQLCPGARQPVPVKVAGASWGLVASGAALCQDQGDAYALSVDYLNVAIDNRNRSAMKRDAVRFDWIGLALYRGRDGAGLDWLFDDARPVDATLRRDETGRIVFRGAAFRVRKQQADQATNLLFYLTFGGLVVALRVL